MINKYEKLIEESIFQITGRYESKFYDKTMN